MTDFAAILILESSANILEEAVFGQLGKSLRGQPTLNMFLAKPYRVTSYIFLWFTLYTTYHISF